MGTIVDASVRAAESALGETFDAVEDAEFDAVRLVAHDAGQTLRFLWGSSATPEALYQALSADSSTRSVERLAHEDDRTLFQVEWDARICQVVSVLAEEDGTILGAAASDDRWTLRVLFPDRDAVSSTFDVCEDAGIDISVRRVTGAADPINSGGVGLSKDQFEALEVAFETDYFAVPRGMTLEALAGELDVSHQALSERLRRGHRNLIANTLVDSPNSLPRAP